MIHPYTKIPPSQVDWKSPVDELLMGTLADNFKYVINMFNTSISFYFGDFTTSTDWLLGKAVGDTNLRAVPILTFNNFTNNHTLTGNCIIRCTGHFTNNGIITATGFGAPSVNDGFIFWNDSLGGGDGGVGQNGSGGSATGNPLFIGGASGAAAGADNNGGDGGGFIIITCNNFINNGVISANGTEAASFFGSPVTQSGSGGGGLIQVFYNGTFTTGTITVDAGPDVPGGSGGPGSPGKKQKIDMNYYSIASI